MLGHAALSNPSRVFDPTQQTAFHVNTWDTPFTPLEANVASAGMVLDAREPNVGTDWRAYVAAFAAATAAGTATAFTGGGSIPLVTNGRSPLILDSWSAGAPAWFGNSQRGRIALHWSGVLRPVAGRSWFASTSAVTMSLAAAGQGFLRVIRTPSGGSPTEVNVGGTAGRALSETDFLTTGVTFTDVFTVSPGDRLDVYYIQNQEAWGGIVVKAVLGSVQTEALARTAPVLGCDLFDDGTPPTMRALPSVSVVEVTQDFNTASSAMINVPLINPNRHDGFGYEWQPGATADDAGTLRAWSGGVPQYSLRRGQLIQITGGLVGEEYTLLTGFIDDFDTPRDGLVTIRCIGFERRPIKDVVRNEPDELSYMVVGYRSLTGASEPVYSVAAYDNWAIEYAIQDVLLRAGINSSRLVAPLLALKADLTSQPVAYGTDNFKKFRARGVRGNLLRCERSVRYGNVGFAFQDFKPADDPYVFKPEDSKDAWSRVRNIGDRYGYDVRFDAFGDAVLQTRGNASTVVDVDNSLVSGSGGITAKARAITIDATKVGSGGVTNYPVTFIGTYTFLKTEANGGSVKHANGYDIGFFSDAGLTTRLPHEIVSWSPTTGAIEAHVKVPALSSGTNTVIYIGYADASITTSQENATGVWDSNFVEVHHMKDGTTLSLTDSTANANHGVNHGATAGVGQVDGAMVLSGTAQWASIPRSTSLDAISAAMSISGWIKLNAAGNNQLIYSRYDSSGMFLDVYGQQLQWKLANVEYSAGASSVPIGSWAHIYATWDGATLNLYVNGVSVLSTARVGALTWSTDDVGIGGVASSGALPLAGSIDEVRVSKIARSLAWITTDYNNQFSPSTFYSVGSEVTVGSAGGPLGTKKTHPSAFRGTYYEWTGGANAQIQFTFTGSRVDVALPRGPGLSSWYYMRVVRVSDAVEVARVNNLVTTAASDVFYYDYRTSTTGLNATLLTLFSGPFDTYQVECVAVNGVDSGTRRLDCFFVYATDPLMPLLASSLSTAKNATQVAGGSNADEQRNLVYVIGRRKAAVTDSEKLKTNPNNAEPEFIVSVAVDSESISNPVSKNYTGARHTSAIFDDSIVDPDYAAYVARTYIYRYRSPRPPADVTHTVLPMLELRDPLFAREAQFGTVTEAYVMWATRFTHRFEHTGAAITSLSTSSWPEFPSYDLRDDIDIDADFGGAPVANIAVQYTTLTGHQVTNLSNTGVVQGSGDADIITANIPVTVGSPDYLDLTGQSWPPIPGTVQLVPSATQYGTGATTYPSGAIGGAIATPVQVVAMRPGGVIGPYTVGQARSINTVTLRAWRPNGATYALDRVFTNLPKDRSDAAQMFYYEYDETTRVIQVFFRFGILALPPDAWRFSIDVTYNTAIGGVHGDVLADSPYHHITNIDYRNATPRIYLPWKQGDGTAPYVRPVLYSSLTVKYRRLMAGADPYSGVSPFADPTTTELGYLCSLTFDAMVTGFYRIAVKSVRDGTTVAYLTEATADPQDPEAHWQYVTAGAQRSFNWDFVDQVGVWNIRQSEDYSAALQGVFELAEKEPIGAGWYVWNLDRDNGALGPLALISADRDANGKPVFGQGTYAAWYFSIEVQNDALLDAHNADASKAYPRVVKTLPAGTGEIQPTYSTGGGTKAAVVYTHLPEPTMAELTVQDWTAGFAYDPSVPAHATTDANWGAADADATLHNQKPVRVQFTVKPRPGALWAGRSTEQQLKLTRNVHLRALVFDQFDVDEGGSYPDSTVPQRTIYSRRLSNDDHTIAFKDAGWRKSSTFRNAVNANGTVQWVFRPADFRKKFRDIENEPLTFGYYLQLMELPKFDVHRAIASSNSHFIIGFMAYLFYLSAWVQDRSGRRCWATNRRFLDKSKIVNNAVGDWWDPATPGTAATTTTYRTDWPVDPTRQQRRSVICRQWTSEPGWQAAQKTRWGFTTGSIGDLLLRHKFEDHDPSATTVAGTTWPTLDLDEHSKWHTDGRSQLPAAFSNLTRQLGTSSTTRLGTWTWEGSPMWVPCITRDFHPYRLVPPMPEYNAFSSDSLNKASSNYWYTTVDVRSYDSNTNEGDDSGAGPTWGSWARDMTEVYSASGTGKKRFSPGTRIDTQVDPNKPTLAQNAHDYVRQDELVHFEDLRGLYSRGSRPAEQPKKIAPAPPYFMNLYRYSNMYRTDNIPRNYTGTNHHSDIPKWFADVASWFRMALRSEYVVETERFFPCDRLGREYLAALNLEKTRYLNDQSRVYYDAGAWTGWKDDLMAGTTFNFPVGTDNDGGAVFEFPNVFESTAMPHAIAPQLPETKDIYMHLVLVNERRASPL